MSAIMPPDSSLIATDGEHALIKPQHHKVQDTQVQDRVAPDVAEVGHAGNCLKEPGGVGGRRLVSKWYISHTCVVRANRTIPSLLVLLTRTCIAAKVGSKRASQQYVQILLQLVNETHICLVPSPCWSGTTTHTCVQHWLTDLWMGLDSKRTSSITHRAR
jgi:hypothetical protein